MKRACVVLLLVLLISVSGCQSREKVGDTILEQKSGQAVSASTNGVCDEGESSYNSYDCGFYGAKPLITLKECIGLSGEMIDLQTGSNGCQKESDFLGTIDDIKCQCVCCMV